MNAHDAPRAADGAEECGSLPARSESPNSDFRRWWRLIRKDKLRLALAPISVAVIFWLLARIAGNVSLADLQQAWSAANPWSTGAAMLLVAFSQWLRILRTKSIMQQHPAVDRSAVTLALLGSQFVNWLSPVRIGELWRIWFVARQQPKAAVWATTCVTMEKSADALALSIFAICALFLPLRVDFDNPAPRLLLVLAACALPVVAVGGLAQNRIRRRLIAAMPERYATLSEDFIADLPATPVLARLWIRTSLWSIAIWTIGVATNIALAHALRLPTDLGIHLLLMLALQTSSVFSPVPGNLGIFPIVAMFVFEPYGVSRTDAFLYGMLLWAVVYGILTIFTTASYVARRFKPADPRNVGASFHLLGVRIDRIRRTDLLDSLMTALQVRRRTIVAYANAYTVETATRNANLRKFFNAAANIVFCDGVGVQLAARLAGLAPPPERFTPPDWIDDLCTRCAALGYRIALLGDKPGVAARAAARLQGKHPDLHIAACESGYFDARPDAEANITLIQRLNAVHADVLLVGMGTPRQELWVHDNAERIEAPAILVVGALFSYLGGAQSRAPRWMTDHGLEWLGRLAAEPARMWKRYLVDLPRFLIKATFRRGSPADTPVEDAISS
jgi:N-acetylglucosaminyldiphosphoundecaprenol N-acetyl-beta-D-mannosaminyltransferase